jgi:hypothetical protein
MKKILLFLITLLYINLSAQNVEVKWSEQLINLTIKQGDKEFKCDSYVFNEQSQEFVFAYHSANSILIKKIDGKTGKETLSKTYSVSLEKNEILYSAFSQIDNEKLAVRAIIFDTKQEKGHTLFNTYDWASLTLVKTAIVDESIKTAINSDLPLDDANSSVAVENKKTSHNNPKMILMSEKYSLDESNSQLILFDDYTENGESAELKFTVKNKNSVLYSSKINLQLSKPCILEEIKIDDKKIVSFCFLNLIIIHRLT